MGLKADIEKFKESIEKDVVAIKRTAARITLKKLLNRSPARSGAYMKSHNVGISKTGAGRGIGRRHATVVTGKFIPKMPDAQKLALAAKLYNQKKGYISTARLKDAITIYNVIPYADQVEYLGWYNSGTEGLRLGDSENGQLQTTPPYHVYGLTIAEMEVIMPLLPKLVSGDINT
jgi:hypothetical protein